MKILKLLEARRNPSLNPKIDTLTSLKQLKAKMATIDGELTNGFVSFTDHNKIGVRPSNSYTSPTGIYPVCEAKTPAFMPGMKLKKSINRPQQTF